MNPELTIYQLIQSQSLINANKIAILNVKNETITYKDLFSQINYVIKQLRLFGINKQDKVAIALPNGVAMAVTFLSVSNGAICCPLNPNYRQREFEFYLSDLNVKALISQEGVAPAAVEIAQKLNIPIIKLIPTTQKTGIFRLESDNLSPQVNQEEITGPNPEDIALVLHTSGTTSRPKQVPLTHLNLCTSAHNISQSLNLEVSDRCLNLMPLFHIHGLVITLLSSLKVGSSIIGISEFNSSQFWQWLDKFEPTWYSGVSTIHLDILQQAKKYQETIDHCTLRFIRTSSAAIPSQAILELEKIFKIPVIQGYGMTEGSPQMTINPLPPQKRNPESVGIACGVKIAIMDEQGNLLKPKEIGEVVVKDLHFDGYWGNSELNERAFCNGWFRTGDLGYLDEDGYLFLKGRIKEVINRGGEKIMPLEVDNVVMELPQVYQAVTFPVPHPTLGEDVVTAVVVKQNQTITPQGIRSYLFENLADFKVPTQVIMVEEIPKGATRKLQRIGLAEKLADVLESENIAPRNETEAKLTEIWQQVLGIEKIGVKDNFFTLGGDSLLATQVVSWIRNSFGVQLPLGYLFELPTVEELSEYLTTSTQMHDDCRSQIHCISREQELPLSFAQQRLWFIDQLEGKSPVYNISRIFSFEGALNISALEEVLFALIERHETLRTNFTNPEEGPYQIIHESVNFHLPLINLENLSQNLQEIEIEKIVQQEILYEFDLEKDSLIRFTLVKTAPEKYIFIVIMHHIISDGWSMKILTEELSQLYQDLNSNHYASLSPLPIQYADFALWQRQWFTGEVLQTQLNYWQEQLKGIPPLIELPLDKPRPSLQTFVGTTETFNLNASITNQLKELAQQSGVTLYITLLAVFGVLLFRYTYQSDLVIGSPIANRNRQEIEGIIGFFANTLALRINLAENPSFKQLLTRVKKVALEAYEHQDLPFEKLVEELNPERNLSHHPIFQVMFSLENTSNSTLDLEELKVESLEVTRNSAKFDLSLFVREKAEELSCVWEYNSDLFYSDTVKRMSGYFQTLLEGIIHNPEQKISLLPLLTEAETDQILIDWNNTQADYPKDKCIHHLFEEQVAQTPDAVAVVFEDSQLTYQQLNERANQLAHYLQELGVGAEVLVGICVERSLEMIVALLAILKAGGAYLPLDPNYPQQRLEWMLEDAQVSLILTTEKQKGQMVEHQGQLVCLDSYQEIIEQQNKHKLNHDSQNHHLAYVMYTSGSTGKPKGVCVVHQGVVRLVKETNYASFTSEDVFVQLAPISFDASTLEIWASLLNGGKLVVMPPHVPSLAELGAAIKEHQITTLWLTAGLFNLMVDERARELRNVRQLLTGGDVVSVTHVQKILEQGGKCRIINGYGPTENTTFTCCYPIEDVHKLKTSIPIGKPIANTQVYILDSQLNPIGIGIPGELYIGGDGLAREYLHRPDLNQKKFITHSFNDQLNVRLYKTGDKARYLPDGNIEFIGRLDNQVKLRGFRIELGEIEFYLSQHPAIKETVVITQGETLNEKLLVAYVVPYQQQEVEIKDLRRFLQKRLPDYMIPNSFVFLDVFPLTPNGKVERKALPKPNLEANLDSKFVAPRNQIETSLAQIWQEVLGIERIGINDNFFALGGHSLLATQVFSRIRQAFALELPLPYLFEFPTIGELGEHLETLHWLQQDSEPTLDEDAIEL